MKSLLYLHISEKSEVTSDSLHELIHNSAKQTDIHTPLRLAKLEPMLWLGNMLNRHICRHVVMP